LAAVELVTWSVTLGTTTASIETMAVMLGRCMILLNASATGKSLRLIAAKGNKRRATDNDSDSMVIALVRKR
jgi:hypothetical protein